jgi:hypothetical protein
MKVSKLALATAIAWGVYAGHAQAQDLQPGSATRSATFVNDYYYQPDNEASPSDRVRPTLPPEASPSDRVRPTLPPNAAEKEVAADIMQAPPSEEATCDAWHLFCQKDSGWNFHGFIDGGVMANTGGPLDGFNGPLTFPDRSYGQMNQAYFIAENTIDTGGCGWDIGGRVDVLYGSDYVYNMETGLELSQTGAPRWNQKNTGVNPPFAPPVNPEYGLALPQFYVEAGYNDLSVKLGHFYTVIGYEVVPSIGNFFYTHAYTMQYGEPFTHTGALATYKYSDSTNLVGGIVNGWDNFDRVVDTGAFLGGFSWSDSEAGRSLAWTIILSPNEPILLGPNAGALTNRNMYSLVFSQSFGQADKWQYVFQHDYGWQQGANVLGGGAANSAEWYGVNQYLFYTINDCWKAGMRFEWFRDDDGARVTGLRNPNNFIFGDSYAGNFFECSFGMNWTPTANVTFRPEIRYDWFDGAKVGEGGSGPVGGGPFRGGTANDQLVVGLDGIFTF